MCIYMHVCVLQLHFFFFKAVSGKIPGLNRGAIKGGFTWLKPKVIVFTSNSTPSEWYPDMSDFDRAAIERRITEIIVVMYICTCVYVYI